MYAEQHPEAETINEPTQNLVDWLNQESEEGRLSIEQTRAILHLTMLAIEHETGQFYLWVSMVSAGN